MLLLDEPMAGMEPEESAHMVETLRSLKRDKSILLIEHDMDAVPALVGTKSAPSTSPNAAVGGFRWSAMDTL